MVLKKDENMLPIYFMNGSKLGESQLEIQNAETYKGDSRVCLKMTRNQNSHNYEQEIKLSL